MTKLQVVVAATILAVVLAAAPTAISFVASGEAEAGCTKDDRC